MFEKGAMRGAWLEQGHGKLLAKAVLSFAKSNFACSARVGSETPAPSARCMLCCVLAINRVFNGFGKIQ